MERLEQTLRNGGSLKDVKMKLSIGKNVTFALRKNEGNVTTNIDNIAEDVYTYLYDSRSNPDDNEKSSSPEQFDTPPVPKESKESLRSEAKGENS